MKYQKSVANYFSWYWHRICILDKENINFHKNVGFSLFLCYNGLLLLKRANLALKSMKITQILTNLQIWPTYYSNFFLFFDITTLKFGFNGKLFDRLYPRLSWVVKSEIQDFYPFFTKFYLHFETPCTSNYHMYTFAIIIYVWYSACGEILFKFSVEDTRFHRLKALFLNHAFYKNKMRSWVCTGPFF